jgi:hypothetical protein
MGEIKDSLVVVTFDREDLLEDTLKADNRPLGRRQFFLEELPIAVQLDLNEVGGVDNFRELAEVEAVRHVRGSVKRVMEWQVGWPWAGQLTGDVGTPSSITKGMENRAFRRSGTM